LSSVEAVEHPLDARERSPAEPVAIAARMAGVLSIVVGAMHAKALGDHVAHWWFFGVFFGALAAAQVWWGVRVYRAGAGTRLLRAGAIGSLAIVAIWVLSRTFGVPVGPWAWDAEPIGASDLIATVDELFIVAFVAAIAQPQRRGLRWLHASYAIRLGIALGTVSLFAALIGGHAH